MTEAGFPNIHSADEFTQCLHDTPALAAWFSGPDCRVCHDLAPKVAALLADKFPLIQRIAIPCDAFPAVAAGQQVFTIPTLLLFFDGRETLRLSRNLSLRDLSDRLERIYGLFFP
jgi:thioredoxin-like negative regulator of GroEL